MKLTGKVSWFGGPDDEGVDPDEGLAFIYEVDDAPGLFLPEQPPDTTGLARRLDPEKHYIACRWDYEETGKDELLDMRVVVYAPRTGRAFIARPADWGPHEDTGRIADISPGLLDALGIETDDEVEVIFPLREGRREVAICISSGHSTKCPGANGLIDEVTEARDTVDHVAEIMRRRGLTVHTFHDTVSETQEENLERICEWHNSHNRVLDVFVHFNANEPTEEPMGTECLYLSQEELAAEMAQAIASAGKLKDRGPKYRDNLYVLNNTVAPGILIEVCFVDSQADVSAYNKNFHAICGAISGTLAAEMAVA